MRSLSIILILLSTVCCLGQGQNDKKKAKQMTISEIKRSFPYNKTETIRLVSFKYDYPVVNESDTIEIPVYEPEIPKTNDQIDLTKMFEVKTLDEQGEIELMRILMNYDHQDTNSVAFCYEPRNGVVFFDKDQIILGLLFFLNSKRAILGAHNAYKSCR